MKTGKWISVAVSAVFALFVVFYLIPALIFSNGSSGGMLPTDEAPAKPSQTMPGPEMSQ